MAPTGRRGRSDFQRGVDLFLRIARKRVQELQAQGVTIREVFERAVSDGRLEAEEVITPSYLSRILSGKLAPHTEETYDKISAILDIPTLFDVRSFLLPHDEKFIHIRAGELDQWGDRWLEIPFEGVPYRTPKENIIDAQMFPFVVDLAPGEKTKRGRYKAEAGEEVALLLDGDEFTIRFEEGDEHVVKRGDSIHYLATRAHYTENTGSRRALILVVRSDPSLYRVISEAFRSAERGDGNRG
jgi:transcriptional regulator with XRE-family HTH domain